MSINILSTTRRIKAKAKKNGRLSAQEICDILQINYPENIDLEYKYTMVCCFEGVFIKDCLFVHYERDDDSVAVDAMNKGAKALLCSHQIDNYPCIIVTDVLSALNKLLQYIYSPISIPSTVVTGSCGKTTTKNFVNCVYSTTYNTFCNITNGNTFEYLGFEIQRLDPKAKLFVQEVNESDPFNAKNCSEVLKPEIALITNMDKSHIGELGGEENIIKAICDITAGMDENGVVIINADDKNSVKPTFRQKVITVSIKDSHADCYADIIEANASHTIFDLYYKDEKKRLTVPVGGVHNVYNAQMAYIAGRLNNISSDSIAKGLNNYKPLGFRQNVYKSLGNVIYADCYNASAKSVGYAIQYLNEMNSKGKKIAVLGDIAEIEGYELDTYREIAKSISESDIDLLVTYGNDSQMIHHWIRKKMQMFHESNETELINRIKSFNSKNDCYLFKGSRSMHLDMVIQKTFPLAYFKGMLPVARRYFKWNLRTL